MQKHSEAAWERAMKAQEVILQAMAKRITWWQAAEILGVLNWSMQRWKRRYEYQGYDGLPHPSGANRESINCFHYKKPRHLRSSKTNPAKIDAAKKRLLAKINELLIEV